MTTQTRAPQETKSGGWRVLLRRFDETAQAWWFAGFAVYAVVVAFITRAPNSTWGTWAAAGYAFAALVARRPRGPALAALIGVCGAVAVPTIQLAARLQPRLQPGGEPAVVVTAAFLLVHHGSPYLPPGQLLSAQSYNPYLPAMSVFGLPRLAGLPGAAGNPASWMAVTTIALIMAAISVALPDRAWRRAPDARALLWRTAMAVVTPVLALPIALGTTDPPVIALMCLALACASRSAEGRPARWVTWNGLAALAIGTACAMKATAWPALPVIAAMIAAREGPRAASRFAATGAATAVVLTAVFAPALIAHPHAFADNIIAYPLGLAHHPTPAASPLPGHLLAGTGTLGRLAALGLLLAAGAAVALSLVLRPPRNARAAAVRLALGLALLFTLAPNTRFGYFAYPAALLGWLVLTSRSHTGPEPGQLRPAEDPVT